MLLALDYDGTYSEDPDMWDVFIRVAKISGHEVVIVTMRHAEAEPVFLPPCMVYYTGRKAKGPWCAARGLNVDIWIDDNPNWVHNDSA